MSKAFMVVIIERNAGCVLNYILADQRHTHTIIVQLKCYGDGQLDIIGEYTHHTLQYIIVAFYVRFACLNVAHESCIGKEVNSINRCILRIFYCLFIFTPKRNSLERSGSIQKKFFFCIIITNIKPSIRCRITYQPLQYSLDKWMPFIRQKFVKVR